MLKPSDAYTAWLIEEPIVTVAARQLTLYEMDQTTGLRLAEFDRDDEEA